MVIDTGSLRTVAATGQVRWLLLSSSVEFHFTNESLSQRSSHESHPESLILDKFCISGQDERHGVEQPADE
jgi:hypothetical protein